MLADTARDKSILYRIQLQESILYACRYCIEYNFEKIFYISVDIA